MYAIRWLASGVWLRGSLEQGLAYVLLFLILSRSSVGVDGLIGLRPSRPGLSGALHDWGWAGIHANSRYSD